MQRRLNIQIIKRIKLFDFFIFRQRACQALKTLGVLTSPFGPTATKLQQVQKFLTELIIEIKSKTLSQLEESLLTLVYLYAKLQYITAATTFTKSIQNVTN